MIELLLGWFRRVSGRPSGPRRYSFSYHKIPSSAFSAAACEGVGVLSREGFEAYVVGGAVRDVLLGIEPKDFDIATNATPEQVKRCFKRAFIIGRRFRLVHVSLLRETIEVSTFRSDAGSTDSEGRLISDNVYGTLADDATRRDFSANALYYDLGTQTIIDYHNGVPDIKKKQLRFIGDPEVRYREDPVRILRAIRLAQKLDVAIDALTAEPIRKLAPLLQAIPQARILDEIEKIFSTGYAADTFFTLQEYGVLRYLWPSLDNALANAENTHFIRTALTETDLRQRQGKSISIPFIFAVLMWPELKVRLQFQKLEELKLDIFLNGIESFLEHQGRGSFLLPRRYSGVIKEVWQLQIRFVQRVGQRPYRFIHHPRFRAALDFLDLRERCEDIDQPLAPWWKEFYSASEDEREQLMKNVLEIQPKIPSKRRRSRSRKSSNGEVVVNPQDDYSSVSD